jgi:uncharacterized protein (TIGR03118 family)
MRIRSAAVASLALALIVGTASTASAQFYSQHNLQSDGAVPADFTDPDLVNAWGLVSSPTSPWWVSDNGTGLSTLYNGNTGMKVLINPPAGHVIVPGPPPHSAPTGVVFNGTTGFAIPGHGTARFIFSSEDGLISAWSGGPTAFVVWPKPGDPASTAVYKGLAIATAGTGTFLYASDFHNGRVDVFDSSFGPVVLGAGAFTDPTLPPGYAPFGIQNIGGIIYVTYALQDADAHDDVPGEGHGFVNAFDTAGHLLGRVASQGPLNSPWGLALAPSDFGKFKGDLLVGNFGDGRIHAYDPADHFELRGPLHSTHGRPIEIDGLWALQFGNGANAGPTNALFFTAGPFEEGHGLFGRLDVAGPPGKDR